jgi:hypothetical protein
VAAEAVALEAGEDVGDRLVGDLADRPRRQLHLVGVALAVPDLLIRGPANAGLAPDQNRLPG